MKNNEVFKVDEIEAISFDENGKENGTWKGFSVVKKGDEANYCFDCRDKINAEQLCEFLNNECIIDDDAAIDAFVIDNCIEWSNLITELTFKEINLFKKKEAYAKASEKLLEDAAKEKAENDNDVIKKKYGGNNDKTRKKYVKDSLAKESMELKELEWSIDYVKRRISFLRQLVPAKTAVLEVKK